MIEWGDKGQWLAVCRRDGDVEVPRLVLGTDDELSFELLESHDPSGRWLVFTREGHRWLFDGETRQSVDLGTIAHTTIGDLQEGMLAYGRRTEVPPQVVLRDLDTGDERTFPSPMPSLHAVELDRSGRGLWLTGSSDLTDAHRRAIAEEDAHLGRQHDCTSRTPCRGAEDLPRRYKGLLWLDEPTPTFVELDDAPYRPRALEGAVVYDGGSGVQLVYPDRRMPIAEPDCRLVKEHYDPERLLLRCGDDDGRFRYAQWHRGILEPLDLWGPGGPPEPAGDTVLPGAWNRWLELAELRTVQGEEHHTGGHAHGDHVLLVGQGLEIRDARTDTRVLHRPGRLELQFVDGPYVALRGAKPDQSGGRVIDIRDGHVVRTHTSEALQLAANGQVLQRSADGRLRWTVD